MRTLNVIESAYRGSLEEQDDTIIWLTHNLASTGADIATLLRGNAVNYAVAAQHVDPLRFGTRQQENAPRIASDVASLPARNVAVFVVREDMQERGIEAKELVDDMQLVGRDQLAELYEQFDRVWYW